MNSKALVTFMTLLGVVIGAVAGRLSVSKEKYVEEIENKTPCPLPLANLPHDPTKVTCDQSEFEQAKNDLKEASALYSKAFNLFLATLGVKLSQGQSSELERLAQSPIDYTPRDDIGRAQIDDNKNNEVDAEATPSELYISREEARLIIREEKANINEIADQQLIHDSIRKIVKDPVLFYARSAYTDEFKTLRRLNGNYHGFLYRIVGKNKGDVDPIAMNVDLFMKNKGEIDGTFSLTLSRSGETYSDSKGTGGNGNIRTSGENIIIKAGPTRYFHFINQRLTEANLYEDGKYVGVARLVKD